MNSYLRYSSLPRDSSCKRPRSSRQLSPDVLFGCNDSRSPLVGSFVVVCRHKDGDFSLSDFESVRVNQILVAREQDAILKPAITDNGGVCDSMAFVAVLFVMSDDHEIGSAEHLGELRFPKSPVGEKDWRLFKLPLSTRNLRLLL